MRWMMPEVPQEHAAALAAELGLHPLSARVLVAEDNLVNQRGDTVITYKAVRMMAGRAAEEHLTRALQLNPDLPLALNTLGVVYVRKGDPVRAQDAWRRSFAADRRQYDALFNLGLLAAQRGDREAARQAFAEFVRIAPRARYARELETARRGLEALR